MNSDSQIDKQNLRVRRTTVIGNCGSGKTTFSKRLAILSNLPVYHLDDLFWNADWTPTKPIVWKEKMRKLVSQSNWIIDGTFDNTLPLRLSRADLIIFLDISLWRCLWRIIVRDIRRYRGQRDTLPLKIRNQSNQPKGGEGIFRFWLYVAVFPIRRRPKIVSQINNTLCSTVILHKHSEIEEWLNTFTSKAIDF